MIEIFRTTIKRKKDARMVISGLKVILPDSFINIDLEDCDKVLKIVTSNQSIDKGKIFKILNQYNFHCEILD